MKIDMISCIQANKKPNRFNKNKPSDIAYLSNL